MSLPGINFNFDVGVNGGVAVIGLIIMLLCALADMASGPGTFGLPFWIGTLAFLTGIGLKILGVGD
jgi:hypothetical protein